MWQLFPLVYNNLPRGNGPSFLALGTWKGKHPLRR